MDMSDVLMEARSKQFDSDGYLVIPNFIANDLCDKLISRANKLISKFNPDFVKTIFATDDQRHARDKYFLDSGNDIRFFFEKDALDELGNLKTSKERSINKIGHALHHLDHIFKKFSLDKNILNLSQSLGINKPHLLQSMYICKQPFIGGEVTCHQDATYLYTENKSVIGLWFALEDATLENGCLWAIPGGHKNKLKSRFIRHSDNRTETIVYDDECWDLDSLVPLEVKKGSVIVLHGLLPHMSKQNFSDKSRHAYTLHVLDEDAQFAPNNWMQNPMIVSMLTEKLC